MERKGRTKRLTVFYRIYGDKRYERLYCIWDRIDPEAKPAREVIRLIKSLPEWKDSVLYCLGRNDAYFSIGSHSDRTYKRLQAFFYVGHENEPTITREEFCKIIDVLLNGQPAHIRKFIKDFANDPETTDCEVQEIAECLLNKICSKENTIQ